LWAIKQGFPRSLEKKESKRKSLISTDYSFFSLPTKQNMSSPPYAVAEEPGLSVFSEDRQ